MGYADEELFAKALSVSRSDKGEKAGFTKAKVRWDEVEGYRHRVG